MRIITGTARGRKLSTLAGEQTRPTAQRVKEAVFSSLQFSIEGRRVLDLFAGSGQMGLEALSRGAVSAVFVDRSPQAVKVIGQNVQATGFSDAARIVTSDYRSFLLSQTDPFDLAFLDPPYSQGILPDALQLLAVRMAQTGTMVCEHHRTDEVPQSVAGFERIKQHRYGQTIISVYRKGRNED